ncbi:MAG TPA: AMP-binding protein, partial [Azospirillaceae bacterium]|nr:AMP-binding protein [Azospirillaceae bacterium]
MLHPARSYEEACRNFRWRIPGRYNIGIDVCDRHATGGADGHRTALICVEDDGQVRRWSFRELMLASNRLGNALHALGVGRGDRVGILLGQSVECALAHLAAYKLGAVAVPLFTLFGEDALEYRLSDSGAKALITDSAQLAKVAPVRDRLPELSVVLSVGGGSKARDFWTTLEQGADALLPELTGPDDPALIIYTSGTTG